MKTSSRDETGGAGGCAVAVVVEPRDAATDLGELVTRHADGYGVRVFLSPSVGCAPWTAAWVHGVLSVIFLPLTAELDLHWPGVDRTAELAAAGLLH